MTDTPDASPVSATPAPPPRRREWRKHLLEVGMIAIGVFLGLMADNWREYREHRELAEQTLRRFRTEIAANREALAKVVPYHRQIHRDLGTYFDAKGPKTLATFQVPFEGLGIVPFQQTAWELAIATQALSYLDPDLAFELSKIYTRQRGYDAQQAAIVQSTIYGRSWTQDFEGYWRSVLAYFGDLNVADPDLAKAYDDILPLIDKALGAPSPEIR